MANNRVARSYCPECDAIITMRAPRVDSVTKRHECHTDLKVISIRPFEVDFPYDADWDREGDYSYAMGDA
jgi:hypothetical protein